MEQERAECPVEPVPEAVFVIWIILVKLEAALAAVLDLDFHHSLVGRVRIDSVADFHNARR